MNFMSKKQSSKAISFPQIFVKRCPYCQIYFTNFISKGKNLKSSSFCFIKGVSSIKFFSMNFISVESTFRSLFSSNFLWRKIRINKLSFINSISKKKKKKKSRIFAADIYPVVSLLAIYFLLILSAKKQF